MNVWKIRYWQPLESAADRLRRSAKEAKALLKDIRRLEKLFNEDSKRRRKREKKKKDSRKVTFNPEICTFDDSENAKEQTNAERLPIQETQLIASVKISVAPPIVFHSPIENNLNQDSGSDMDMSSDDENTKPKIKINYPEIKSKCENVEEPKTPKVDDAVKKQENPSKPVGKKSQPKKPKVDEKVEKQGKPSKTVEKKPHLYSSIDDLLKINRSPSPEMSRSPSLNSFLPDPNILQEDLSPMPNEGGKSPSILAARSPSPIPDFFQKVSVKKSTDRSPSPIPGFAPARKRSPSPIPGFAPRVGEKRNRSPIPGFATRVEKKEIGKGTSFQDTILVESEEEVEEPPRKKRKKKASFSKTHLERELERLEEDFIDENEFDYF